MSTTIYAQRQDTRREFTAATAAAPASTSSPSKRFYSSSMLLFAEKKTTSSQYAKTNRYVTSSSYSSSSSSSSSPSAPLLANFISQPDAHVAAPSSTPPAPACPSTGSCSSVGQCEHEGYAREEQEEEQEGKEDEEEGREGEEEEVVPLMSTHYCSPTKTPPPLPRRWTAIGVESTIISTKKKKKRTTKTNRSADKSEGAIRFGAGLDRLKRGLKSRLQKARQTFPSRSSYSSSPPSSSSSASVASVILDASAADNLLTLSRLRDISDAENPQSNGNFQPQPLAPLGSLDIDFKEYRCCSAAASADDDNYGEEFDPEASTPLLNNRSLS